MGGCVRRAGARTRGVQGMTNHRDVVSRHAPERRRWSYVIVQATTRAVPRLWPPGVQLYRKYPIDIICTLVLCGACLFFSDDHTPPDARYARPIIPRANATHRNASSNPHTSPDQPYDAISSTRQEGVQAFCHWGVRFEGARSRRLPPPCAHDGKHPDNGCPYARRRHERSGHRSRDVSGRHVRPKRSTQVSNPCVRWRST